MTYFLIRHKETKLFMPQAKKDRGYSHWNPAVDKKYTDGGMKAALRVPRLLNSRLQATQCIIQWSLNPNARITHTRSWEGYETDDDIVTKEDGRKREDLEVVEVDITEVSNE